MQHLKYSAAPPRCRREPPCEHGAPRVSLLFCRLSGKHWASTWTSDYLCGNTGCPCQNLPQTTFPRPRRRARWSGLARALEAPGTPPSPTRSTRHRRPSCCRGGTSCWAPSYCPPRPGPAWPTRNTADDEEQRTTSDRGPTTRTAEPRQQSTDDEDRRATTREQAAHLGRPTDDAVLRVHRETPHGRAVSGTLQKPGKQPPRLG